MCYCVLSDYASLCIIWLCITVYYLIMHHCVLSDYASLCIIWLCITVYYLIMHHCVLSDYASLCIIWLCITVCIIMYPSTPRPISSAPIYNLPCTSGLCYELSVQFWWSYSHLKLHIIFIISSAMILYQQQALSLWNNSALSLHSPLLLILSPSISMLNFVFIH